MSDDLLPTLRARVEAAQALAARATPGPWEWLQDWWHGGFSALVAGNMDVLRPVCRNEGDTGAAWFENERNADLGLLSAAPDLVTLATDLLAEADRLRLRVAELEEKYCNHNVAATLTADGNNRLR